MGDLVKSLAAVEQLARMPLSTTRMLAPSQPLVRTHLDLIYYKAHQAPHPCKKARSIIERIPCH
jgi:hypothetical protein